MRRYRQEIVNAAIDAERTFKCKWPKESPRPQNYGTSLVEVLEKAFNALHTFMKINDNKSK